MVTVAGPMLAGTCPVADGNCLGQPHGVDPSSADGGLAGKLTRRHRDSHHGLPYAALIENLLTMNLSGLPPVEQISKP